MLAARLAERDMILLTDWEAADKLNQVDVTLPPETVWTATAWGLADFMDLLGIAEAAQFLNAAENYPSGPFILFCRLVEQGKFDMSRPSSRAIIDLSVKQGILTNDQATTILNASRLTKHPTWAAYHKVHVDARAVGLARGGK